MSLDRAIVAEHLAQAKRHVAQGERHIAEQRRRIDKLAREGLSTDQAKALLKQFEELQELHVSEMKRLRKMSRE